MLAMLITVVIVFVFALGYAAGKFDAVLSLSRFMKKLPDSEQKTLRDALRRSKD